MGIESGTTISSLNEQWPLETDPTHEGNDHIQLVKNVLKKQFPGRDEQGQPEDGYSIPVTAKAEELNFLEGVTSNVQAQLDAESGARSDLIRDVDTVVVVGMDANDHTLKLETTNVNGIVQAWENSGEQVATVMNSLNVVDLIYPVGSVIYSADATNPGDRFTGTTWEAVGEGRFIASVGTHTDINTDEGTIVAGDILGGTYNHTLTEAEMPAHTHALLSHSGSQDQAVRHYMTNGSPETTPQTESTGGSAPHNNVPPGYGLYVWERTV